MYIVTFFIELLALFFLSILLTRKLSHLFYRVTRSKRLTIYLLAILFFPGTFIHEISHYLMAVLLNVHAGTIEFLPKLEGQTVKLGSVMVAKTDLIRKLLIGMAPFLFGTCILLGLLFFAAKNNLFDNHLFLALILYAVFEIGNTMFSSRKDMEGAIELLIILCFMIAVIGAAYYFGLRLPSFDITGISNNPLVVKVFQKGSIFLLVPLCIDTTLIFIMKLLKF